MPVQMRCQMFASQTLTILSPLLTGVTGVYATHQMVVRFLTVLKLNMKSCINCSVSNNIEYKNSLTNINTQVSIF